MASNIFMPVHPTADPWASLFTVIVGLEPTTPRGSRHRNDVASYRCHIGMRWSGQADAVFAARQDTLDRAFRENRARFVNKPPTPPAKPTAAWINPPQPKPMVQA